MPPLGAVGSDCDGPPNKILWRIRRTAVNIFSEKLTRSGQISHQLDLSLASFVANKGAGIIYGMKHSGKDPHRDNGRS